MTGITDGAFTEILKGEISPDDQVIVGLSLASDKPATGRSRGLGL